MRRRRFLSLPYEDQVPALASMLATVEEGSATGPLDRVEPPDPERLVAATLHHNLAGHAAAAIESGALELPPEQQRGLARSGALRILHARVLRSALAEIEPALHAACGCKPILIKGPAVADRFYLHAGLRPFGDLDLLLPRERLPAAVDAARELGYEPLEEFRPGFGEAHGHDVHVRRSAGRRTIDVELHWRIGDDPVGEALDHRRLASSAESLALGGVAVAVPALPEQLLCLAVHFLSDRAKRLVWLNDIVLVARAAPEPEWRRAFELADELGTGWVLHRTFDYAERHLGFSRERPRAAGPRPAFGALRAVEEIDARASTHVGRLNSLPWRERPAYLRDVLLPTPEGLRGTVGGDGAPTWRLLGRHLRSVVAGLGSPRGR